MGILRKKGGGDVYAKRLSSRGKTTLPDDIAYRVGTLRSELDEPSNMPQAFEDLVTQAAKAKLAYDNGELNRTQYATVLRGLRLVAPDGTEWTTGATSGTWYCRPVGGSWVRATPPTEENTNTLVPVKRVLPPQEVVIPSGAAGIKSGESYKPMSETPIYGDVKQEPSAESPVAWRGTEQIDEHGVWSGTWSAPERSKPVSEDDLLDEILKAAASMSAREPEATPAITESLLEGSGASDDQAADSAAFEVREEFDPFGDVPEEDRRSDGGGWAAWGLSPDGQ